MGIYTELVLKVDLNSNLPEQVSNVLNFMFKHDIDKPLDLPDHEFFTTARWTHIGNSSSYYHVPVTLNYYDRDQIFSRSDLKNYGGNIQLFIDWIKPYLNHSDGDCIGWIWYEEDAKPELIIYKDK